MSLTDSQRSIIRATVPILASHGKTITRRFYDNMLSEHLELQDIFSATNQATGRQAAALAHGLLAYAQQIDHPDALADFVEKVAHRHASLAVEAGQYRVIGHYLLAAMGEVLRDAFTDDVRQAWTAAYWALAGILMDREQQLYRQDPSWTAFRPMQVARRQQESSVIVSFYLKPLSDPDMDGGDGPLPLFKPGQYVSVRIQIPGTQRWQSRQYSLSAAPNPDYYRISVKKEPRRANLPEPAFVSNVLHETVQEGDTLEVSHPRGNFFCDPAEHGGDETSPVVLLSAGVGITPMISILDSLVQAGGKRAGERPITFVHGARSPMALAFAHHVDAICARHSNVRRRLFVKQPAAGAVEGREYDFASRVRLDLLDAEQELWTGNDKARYFVCGPEGFMSDVEAFLVSKRVGRERISSEKFGV